MTSYSRRVIMRVTSAAVIFLFLSLIATIQSVNGARILVLFPVPSYSHQIVYHPILRELSKRGHELVVLTADVFKDENYTQIDFSQGYKAFKAFNFIDQRRKNSWFDAFPGLIDLSYVMAEGIFEHAEMKKLYAPNSNEKFDLVIAEALIWHSTYAFAHRFNAPLIGFCSLGLYSTNHYSIGNAVLPSHDSNWESFDKSGQDISFFQRVKNFIDIYMHMYVWFNKFIPEQQRIAEKYLGKIPPLEDINRNMSLLFVEQREVISYVRPNVPNVKIFGRLHVKKIPPPLPKDLKDFLDGAKEGFVYVSLGTNIKSSLLPPDTLQLLLDTFSKLPQRIIWKFEKTDKISGLLPKNIMMAKWLPQQSVLAHPNIKLFMYQGGLQSTEEAVEFGVPLLVAPVWFDQDKQAKRMVTLGVARGINILQLTKPDFEEAITDLLTNNKKYKERMAEVSAISKDLPYDYLDNTIWWIEYVIRWRGAKHLHSSTADEPWYQRSEMDVVAFLSASLVIVALFALYVLGKLLRCITKLLFKKPTVQSKKLKKK